MYSQEDLKKLRVTMMIKVLLIFGGIIFMQLIAYMLCVLGYVAYGMMRGGDYARLLAEVTILGADFTDKYNVSHLGGQCHIIVYMVWSALYKIKLAQ